MKKIVFSLILFLFLTFTILVGYLVLFGYETDKFNNFLESKIKSSIANLTININKIKVKINLKNLNFFITTSEPNIEYRGNKIDIKKIDANIKLNSLLSRKPQIDKINLVTNEINIEEIKEVVKYLKPSNFKKFLLNEVKKGKITSNVDLFLNNNEIKNYEVNGYTKNLSIDKEKINLKEVSFIYFIKKNSAEIDNLRGFLNGLQINSGSIKFDNSKSLNVQGNLNSYLDLNKLNFTDIFKNQIFERFEDFQLIGNVEKIFQIKFDQTLKIIDYKFEALGNIKKSKIKFKEPINFLFVKNTIKNIDLEKSDFKINYGNKDEKILKINGSYKINNNSFQKFNLTHFNNLSSQKISIDGNFDEEIIIPILNYSSKKKIINLNTELETKKNKIHFKKFTFLQGKNNISIKNLYLDNEKLTKFDSVTVKTFKKNELNNDFQISYGKKIKIKGLSYDATNLTKLFDKSASSNFLKNINKEILINIKEITNNVSETLFSFNLIGYLEKGKFNKIVSKGEFKDGKYLDISLRVDSVTNKKKLEIYSDLPKPLLSNYKFFDGLTGGQLLILSSYDDNNSNINLSIENFKVKDAPDLVKLLSLADFGGMVDALSGDGLSFEKLEMSMEKNNQVINLNELYAIGPSISILMEGYVETKTGLVSLKGTMVPAKTLNIFLSKLPIVGDILIPKEIGEGLFGISFKMKGMPGKIKTTINPIKTLTPRFIQKALKKAK
tara:strand:- start:751 stop:2922 length:2172 start_codon:yes stop_codon:yes gene_type:complete